MTDNHKKPKFVRSLIAEYKILAWDDGNVQIEGPFQNFLLFRQIMNKAEMAAIQRLAEMKKSSLWVPQ